MAQAVVVISLYLKVISDNDQYPVSIFVPKDTLCKDLADIITTLICRRGKVTSVNRRSRSQGEFAPVLLEKIKDDEYVKLGDVFFVDLIDADIDFKRLEDAIAVTILTDDEMSTLQTKITNAYTIKVHLQIQLHLSFFKERSIVMDIRKGTRYSELSGIITGQICKSGTASIETITKIPPVDPAYDRAFVTEEISYDDARVVSHVDFFRVNLCKCDINVNEFDTYPWSPTANEFGELRLLLPLPSTIWVHRVPRVQGFINIGQFDNKPGAFSTSAYLNQAWTHPFRFSIAMLAKEQPEESVNQTIARFPNAVEKATFSVIPPYEEMESSVYESLRVLVDSEFDAAAPDLDLKLDIDLTALEKYIPSQQLTEIVHFFTHYTPVPPKNIRCVLRRCAEVGKFIDFHVDAAPVTLQMALNGEKDYGGGRLVYLHDDLLESPSRPKGTITIHENDIVHGVTMLTSGVRYSLYLFEKSD